MQKDSKKRQQPSLSHHVTFANEATNPKRAKSSDDSKQPLDNSDLDDKTRQEFEDLLNAGTEGEPVQSVSASHEAGSETKPKTDVKEQEADENDVAAMEQAAYEARFAKLLLLKNKHKQSNNVDVDFKPSLSYLNDDEDEKESDASKEFSISQMILKRKMEKEERTVNEDEVAFTDPYNWRMS